MKLSIYRLGRKSRRETSSIRRVDDFETSRTKNLGGEADQTTLWISAGSKFTRNIAIGRTL